MPPKKKQDKINRDEIEAEYGLSYALFQAFPELRRLLQKAVNQNYDANKFQVELRQTEWFKKHSDIWRQNIALKYSDPATYKERLQNSRTALENLAGAYDADLTKKATRRLAERALLLGWDENQIRDVLASHVRPGKDGHYEGQLSAIEDQLRSTATRNGVRLDRDQMKRWIRQIVRGNASQEQFESHIRAQAAKTFKAYADQINGGVDMYDIASPYMQSMAEILELNPTSIDMYDRTIRKALSYKNDKGHPEAMSISDFEDELRKDRRWQYTDGARQQATEYAIRLGEAFGVL